jgi:hypothetical protein
MSDALRKPVDDEMPYTYQPVALVDFCIFMQKIPIIGATLAVCRV